MWGSYEMKLLTDCREENEHDKIEMTMNAVRKTEENSMRGDSQLF